MADVLELPVAMSRDKMKEYCYKFMEDISKEEFKFEKVIIHTDSKNTRVIVGRNCPLMMPDIYFGSIVFLTDIIRYVNCNVGEKVWMDCKTVETEVGRIPHTSSSPLNETYIVSIKKK